ncbi:MAG: RNA methyltransferase [Bacteroidota bacterium]
MDILTKKRLFEFLSTFISENRKELFEKNIQERTKYITIVLDNVYQSHNASAILRSSECMGIQDVHIIQSENNFEANSEIALGSSQWLDLHKYNQKDSITEIYQSLRKKNYSIVATSPNNQAFTPETLPMNTKLAFVFGTELRGLSNDAMEQADFLMKIPMYGFTQSLNISVSVGITSYIFIERLRKMNINWQLGEEEMLDVKINWARSTIKRVDLLEKEFFKEIAKQII